MEVKFLSFGIKYGVPREVDTFLDVRAIPNPYWISELKDLTGEDKKAIDYMMSFPITMETINSIISYLDKVFAIVEKEKDKYVVGIACTGGQHRSTFVANYLRDYYSDKFKTSSYHRDTPKLNKWKAK